jgi:hypothetical protein
MVQRCRLGRRLLQVVVLITRAKSNILTRKLKPPLVPKLKYEGDTSNFDDYPEDDLNKVPGVSEREQRIFDDF